MILQSVYLCTLGLAVSNTESVQMIAYCINECVSTDMNE